MEIIRQGDIILRKIGREQIPAILWGHRYNAGEIRIAGETGHAHVLKGIVYGDGRTGSVIELTTPTELQHEEHDNILVQPGIYAVDSVRDYRAIKEGNNRYRFD